jgi:hypothetical protein
VYNVKYAAVYGHSRGNHAIYSTTDVQYSTVQYSTVHIQVQKLDYILEAPGCGAGGPGAGAWKGTGAGAWDGPGAGVWDGPEAGVWEGPGAGVGAVETEEDELDEEEVEGADVEDEDEGVLDDKEDEVEVDCVPEGPGCGLAELLPLCLLGSGSLDLDLLSFSLKDFICMMKLS